MDFVEQILAILMVLGILCGGLWALSQKGWLRNNFQRAPNKSGRPLLEIVDRLNLTPQHSVHLIRMADRVLLVGLSPAGCSLLETSSSAVELAVRRDA